MGRLALLTQQIGWYVRSLMGDNHYDRYLQHRHRTHPGEPVLSERDYWKLRYSLSSADPRCC
ncbi:MAG: YbdD/YjiX family protein [Mycobacterium sp.]